MASAAPEIPSLARDRAFENLYRRYVKDVYHYALALLRNPADAEDVTQTTFMNAYRAYKRGEEIEKPQNWLIKIAHNAARTRYARAGRRVKEVPLEDHVEQLAVPDDEKPDIEAVLEALGRLPLNQRAALVMRELEGRTYADIADTLGVSVSAVETLIFRARRSLRVRASAVRVLSVVPVPTSLSQFFDAGGAAVVGGGAIVGGGFLVKAAVAIVAGVVATGVAGGSHPSSVAAAAAGKLPAIWRSGNEKALRVREPTAPSLAAAVRVAARRSVHTAAIRGAVVTPRRNVLPPDDRDAAPSSTASRSGGNSGDSGATTAAASSQGQPAPPTTTAASTVQSVTAPVSAPAVPVPAAPTPPPVALPVQPPPIPPVPSLP